MMVTLDEMKNYLRVDYEDDDALIENLIAAAKRQCKDILRTDDKPILNRLRMEKSLSCLQQPTCMSTGRKRTIML